MASSSQPGRLVEPQGALLAFVEHLGSNFFVEALEEALEHYGAPEIFNTDQGSQFTSLEFTEVLKDAGVKISMDGKGRWMDNLFIERLWRSLKYECVYMSEFATGSEARAGIGWWMSFYKWDSQCFTSLCA